MTALFLCAFGAMGFVNAVMIWSWTIGDPEHRDDYRLGRLLARVTS